MAKRTRKAVKVSVEGFWLGVVYTLVDNDNGTRAFELWSVRVEATEEDLNLWLGTQPKNG